MGSDDFGKLASTPLTKAGRDDPAVMGGLLREIVVEMDEHTLEWPAVGADSPIGFLINRIRTVRGEQG
jgi:hypothetical protein